MNEPSSLMQLALCAYCWIDAHIDHGLSLSYFRGPMLTSSWLNPSDFIILLARLWLARGIDDHVASVVMSTGLVATPSAPQEFGWEGMGVHIALGLWFFDALLFAAGFAY